MHVAQKLEQAKDLLEAQQPDQALKLLGGAWPKALRREALFLRAEALRALGDLGACAPSYREALKDSPESEPDLWLEACLALAGVCRSLARLAEARARLKQGRALARALGRWKRWRGPWELEEALVVRAAGRYAESLRLLASCLARARATKDAARGGFVLWAMAGARRFSGDLKGSLRDFKASLAASTRAGDQTGRAYALLGLGGIARILGRLEESRRWYAAAESATRKSPDLFARAYAQCGLANALRQLGRLEESRRRYAASRRLYARIGDPVDGAYVDWGEGQIALKEGRLREAQALLRRALSAFRKGSEARGEVLSLLSLASAAHSAGRTGEGESLFDRGLRRARRAGLHAHLEAFT